ncbi:hypothetical protein PF003_g40589 [Phytophthora fragariae]|nr:hypothetical protein PF003_g40589 [Phytophthora fragariae]
MSYSSFGGRSGCRDDPRGDFVRRRDETRGDFARRRDEPRGDGGENEPEYATGQRNRKDLLPHQSHARHEEPDLDINSKVGDEHLALGPPGGIIDPTTVSKLDNKDLSPKHNVKLLEEHISHLNQKMLMKTSTLYCCRQCGRKKTAERSAQMRSLDEGETLIITCTWCSYKWFV